jgi:ATP-dependent DNA ligase
MESWLSPMLCATADVVPEGPDWVLEGKIDGWRAVTHITADGTVCLYGGRNGNAYSGQVPYIEAELLAMLPPDSAVDGELIGSGLSGGMGYVQSTMTSSAPHKPSAIVPPLSYVVFDITRYAGADLRALPWEDRRSKLEALFLPVYPDESTGRKAFEPKWKHVRLNPTGESTQASHDAMLALGLEGSVCKRKNSRYTSGRSQSWVKVKWSSTLEAVIVGFKDSKTGPHVGAFEVELLGEGDVPTGITTTVKCGTAERHASATAERDLIAAGGRVINGWIGTVIEIKHNGIGDSGVPRHPNFVRRRDDRSAAPAKIRTAPTRERPRMAGGPTNRNYGAMGDKKLLKCIDELENGGDARERVEAKGGDPAADLEIARNIAAARGLEG